MITILILFICTILVSILGEYRKVGFWTTFMVCLLITPILGIIFVLNYKDDHEKFLKGKYNRFKRNLKH